MSSLRNRTSRLGPLSLFADAKPGGCGVSGAALGFFRRRLGVLGAFLSVLALAAPSAQAAFTSLYVFGDGVSTTTSNIVDYPLSTYYYGRRSCNGRVWVEVLAQRQGLAFDHNKNQSYFGHYSAILATNSATFLAPPDAGTALFVVWVNDADFVGDMYGIGDPNNSAHGTNLMGWNAAINQSLTNHLKIITNLYAKGARTLLMPNAVDIMRVPYFVHSPSGNKAFVRQRIMDFNTAFASRLDQVQAALTNLKIYSPDFFALMDDVLAHSASYGLANALDDQGFSIDALTDPELEDKSLNGRGTNYVFWDYLDPTAKASAVLADYAQRLLSPARITAITPLTSSNQLAVASLPLGLSGFVDATTNFTTWTPVQKFDSTNVLQIILAPAQVPARFYRLRFPFAWSWP